MIEIECNGAIEVVDVVAILHGEASGEFFCPKLNFTANASFRLRFKQIKLIQIIF